MLKREGGSRQPRSTSIVVRPHRARPHASLGQLQLGRWNGGKEKRAEKVECQPRLSRLCLCNRKPPCQLELATKNQGSTHIHQKRKKERNKERTAEARLRAPFRGTLPPTPVVSNWPPSLLKKGRAASCRGPCARGRPDGHHVRKRLFALLHPSVVATGTSHACFLPKKLVALPHDAASNEVVAANIGISYWNAGRGVHSPHDARSNALASVRPLRQLCMETAQPQARKHHWPHGLEAPTIGPPSSQRPGGKAWALGPPRSRQLPRGFQHVRYPTKVFLVDIMILYIYYKGIERTFSIKPGFGVPGGKSFGAPPSVGAPPFLPGSLRNGSPNGSLNDISSCGRRCPQARRAACCMLHAHPSS